VRSEPGGSCKAFEYLPRMAAARRLHNRASAGGNSCSSSPNPVCRAAGLTADQRVATGFSQTTSSTAPEAERGACTEPGSMTSSEPAGWTPPSVSSCPSKT